MLHFAEIYANSAGFRKFDVAVQGEGVIDDLDIYATVGKFVAFAENVTASVSDEKLTIALFPVNDSPKINAIEVHQISSSVGTYPGTTVPSDSPSLEPSVSPSTSSSLPTDMSDSPSIMPTLIPSAAPSGLPSLQPSLSDIPSESPSLVLWCRLFSHRHSSEYRLLHPSDMPSLQPSMSDIPSVSPRHQFRLLWCRLNPCLRPLHQEYQARPSSRRLSHL